MHRIAGPDRELILEIAAKHGIENVRVFGSVARGTDKIGSDVDLLVRFSPLATLITVIGFRDAVSELLKRRVDVVDESALLPRLAPTVLREAVPL